MTYDAVLFDFDGVLADTEPLHYACWREVLAPFGVRLDWETYHQHFVGVSDRAMLDFVARQASPPVTAEALWSRYDDKRALFRTRAEAADLIPAATVEMLHSLAGSKLAVVTSSGRREVEPLLERAGVRALFGATVYREDVARHKP
ncbi:MAG: HAD family hydrolase, partial [Bryobacteraceae bacterium]